MDRTEILEKIRRIELRLKNRASNLSQGEYQTSSKGQGLVFSEVRNYQYGDDVRNIDWNVTARYRDTHVKVFEEEKDKSIILMIDVSSSSLLGYNNDFKKSKAIEIAASIMLSAFHHQLNVGAALFSNKIEKYFPHRKGKANVLTILNAIIDMNSKGLETSFVEPLNWCRKNIKKNSSIVLISDLQAKQNYFDELKFLSIKHEVSIVKLRSHADMTLPQVGIIEVINPENNKREWINTDHRMLRESFNKKQIKRNDRIADFCRKNKVNFREIDCHQEVYQQINKLFSK